MTSSSTGDRRWGTTRRSGMTILGKVAVPKPINLPSQRLENKGLDPDVEIVPKGTLSWGSKSSLNAWGSSSLSPRTDSGAGSPSHFSNRPSSGGTGTRPSTAGSDNAHDSSSSAWKSNSRPTSASGVLPSTQISLASQRPHSAETRPGSSQLSRFAEAVPENSSSWRVTPSKNDGFSLASGDFPSLGTEKESSGKSSGPQDDDSHIRPGPSSEQSAEVRAVDCIEDPSVRSGDGNTWRSDHQPYCEAGTRHGIEGGQIDCRGPQAYPNASFPHHHFGTSHGPPVSNHPGAVWYRGNHQYGRPMGPGGFHMDPFPYYLSQVPPGPGSSAGARGNQPTSGDMFRPPISDPGVLPRMPIRPGFYPGPVPFEGYYGPSMGYCNPNNRDPSFAGRPAGPYGYNMHSGQGGYDHPGGLVALEQIEPAHSQEARGPFKVLLKPQDGRFAKDEAKREESGTNRLQNSEKVAQQRPSSKDDRREVRNDRILGTKTLVSGLEVSSHTWEDDPSETVKSRLPEQQLTPAAYGEVQLIKEENAASGDPTLIRKVEGINAKTRTTDGGRNSSSVSSGDEQGIKSRTVNSGNSVNIVAARTPRTRHARNSKNPGHYDQGEPATNRNTEVEVIGGTTISRRHNQVTQGRADHPSERRDISGSSYGKSAADSINFTQVIVGNSSVSDPIKNPGSYPAGKIRGEFEVSADTKGSQHSTMRDLARQHAQQRLKEEEERAREQQAKALAKLEELDRRSQVVEQGLIKKLEVASDASVPEMPHDPRSLSPARMPSSSDFVPPHHVHSSPRVKTGFADKSAMQYGVTCTEYEYNEDTTQQDNLPFDRAGAASKQKHFGYKQKQNFIYEKRRAGKSSSVGRTEITDVIPSPEVISEGVLSPISGLPAMSSMSTESTCTKRKNNRNGKRRHKVEETTTVNSPVIEVGREIKSGDESIGTGKAKFAELESGSGSGPSSDCKLSYNASEQRTYLTNEVSQGRAKSSWKTQHLHRTQRNSQGNKPTEKFHATDAAIWAPVIPQEKANIPPDDASQHAVSEFGTSSKSPVQTNSKSRRGEIERYVPKPIVKEMAEQSESKKDKAATDMVQGTAQKNDSGSEGNRILQLSGITEEKPGSPSELGVGIGRQSKSGRHGSWRQRGSAESAKATEHVQSVTSNQPIGRSKSNRQTDKDDVVKERTTSNDDGWNMIPETNNSVSEQFDPTSAPHAVADGKVQGLAIASRGSKGGGGCNYDDHESNNNTDSNKLHMQHSGSGSSQPDLSSASKEIRGSGVHSSSHWKPKTHTDKYGGPGNAKRGAYRSNKNEFASSETHGFTREEETATVGTHPECQIHPPTDKEVQLELNSSSGFRNNSGQSQRLGKGQENMHHGKLPSSRDRQRQSSHYVYQPVGPQTNYGERNQEQLRENSQSAGGQIHGHPRHGGERFYQQHRRGSVRRETGYYD